MRENESQYISISGYTNIDQKFTSDINSYLNWFTPSPIPRSAKATEQAKRNRKRQRQSRKRNRIR